MPQAGKFYIARFLPRIPLSPSILVFGTEGRWNNAAMKTLSGATRWLGLTALLGIVLFQGSPNAVVLLQRQAVSTVPDHLMVLASDEMRPNDIDRFALANFQRLRADSRNYPEAYVGHLGSQTVVSHLVLSTGLLPKDLPWQDEYGAVDERGVLGKQDRSRLRNRALITRSVLGGTAAGIPAARYLPARVREKNGKKSIAISERKTTPRF